MKTIRTFHIGWLAILPGLVQQCTNKIFAIQRNYNIPFIRKLFLVSLPIFLLVTSTAHAQTITLVKKNATLETIFLEISKQTGYNFFYDYASIQKAEKITVNLSKVSLEKVLAVCAEQQPFDYSIDGRNINIQLRELSKPPDPAPAALTGKVTDINGKPLAGTNIRVKGGTTGTVADEHGSFELTGIQQNTILEISHIGYESQLIKINDPAKAKEVKIILEPGLKTLDEVVTNGYRTTTRRDNLGTTTKITAEEIGRQPVNNILAAIEGRVPGMIITQRGGLPGAPFTIQIRGQRSVGVTPTGQIPPNSPLFIVDGVPFLNSSETLTQRDKILANNPFNTLNPADIESVEILRDANATSIYGSLGANGVVLITTKKAKPGTNSLTVSMYAGIGNITRATDYMNTQEYLEMRNEAFRNDGETLDSNNAYDLLLWNTTRYTNWKKLLIGGTAHFSDAHIRYSAGSAFTQFALSVGYNKETTVFPGDHGKSLTSASLNIEHKSPDKKFELSLTTSYGYDNSNLVARDPSDAINTPPNAPSPYDDMGRLNFSENGYPFNNPVSYLFQPYKVTMERLTTGLQLNYKITPWLKIRTNAGYTFITGDETLLFPIASQNPAFNPTGLASFGTNKNRSWILEPQLEFADTIGKSVLKILSGTSLRSRIGKANVEDGFGFTNDAGLNSISNAATVTTFTDYRQYRVISAYGLISYSWDRKYLIEGTIRRDGSSRFGPDKKFANFASLAAGWIFSNEKFIQNILPFISFGKLRASYGTTGNDQIGDYQFLDAWVNNRPYQIPSFKPSRLANNDYHWELQKSLDLGIDIGFFKDRIMLNTTWNQSRTSDQLIAFTLPAQTGFTTVIKNFPAVTQNRNLEIELNTINIRNSMFKWTTSLNLSIQKNKLLKFPGIESTDYGVNKFVVGQPLNLAWGYHTAGLDPASGIYRILDKKGNVISIPNTLPSSDEFVNLGTYDPDFFGGLQNSIEYGNWQLHFLFQFVKQMGRHSIYSSDKTPGFPVNQSRDLLNRWQQPGNSALYQQYTQNTGTPAYYSWFSASTSDLAFTDASFIRLKNLSVSYSLPDKLTNKMRFKNFRVYAQGQNLITFTRYKGNDPETNENRDGLPPIKVFTAGIQASF